MCWTWMGHLYWQGCNLHFHHLKGTISICVVLVLPLIWLCCCSIYQKWMRLIEQLSCIVKKHSRKSPPSNGEKFWFWRHFQIFQGYEWGEDHFHGVQEDADNLQKELKKYREITLEVLEKTQLFKTVIIGFGFYTQFNKNRLS